MSNESEEDVKVDSSIIIQKRISITPLLNFILVVRLIIILLLLYFNNRNRNYLNYLFFGVYIRGSSYCSVATRTPKPGLAPAFGVQLAV